MIQARSDQPLALPTVSALINRKISRSTQTGGYSGTSRSITAISSSSPPPQIRQDG